ncbi:MbtH family NRPS accessory protein [Pseudoclavibacter sp. JSM 162008]|uniref:MbtH family NRPS accessory protein n=1 Tax=Pseudoclavibacter sp. JSM 162008 TaxID=3229855 RepID=UPI003526591A
MAAWDDAGAQFQVLRNVHREYSLWPDFADIPKGWESVFGPAAKRDCRAYLAREHPEREPEP